ncbi:hypothetical protein HO133_001286 [Letharia lupina]|uniref:Uncharacterized protein n=1 Tax=Letharia lupina TaxID=560253 RepID=A0A8H6FBF4_9LECA|nr:uncharacterized protein HO133_001286 [Letharia lupina]KAF6222200.1 hypothetical protein HO133_001286 [Letharia lupina]
MYVWGKPHGFILSVILISIAVAAPSAIPVFKNDDVSANAPPQPAPSTEALCPDPLLPRIPVMRQLPAGVHVTVAHGWVITARAIASFIVPVQTMAAVLDSFYHDALVQLATSSFENKPHPGHAFGLSIGSVNLALRAVNSGDYLTWEACEVVVASLLHDAQMGFTGQFRSEWYHAESGVLLFGAKGAVRNDKEAAVEGDRDAIEDEEME